MNFIIYDLTFLILFTIGIIWFLYKRRKKVVREGIMFLYKTRVGLKVIDYIGNRYKKLLRVMSYFVVSLGYILMVSIIYLLIMSIYNYVKYPQIIEIIKAPPIILLIPYFPRIFGVQEFFPAFYFIYFLVAIVIVATVHEGFHGIYAKLYNIRIKSTGFGFLGPILAFFVEQDDKQMRKKKIFPQLTVLGAGVFANIVVAVIFFVLLLLFFNSAYMPYGVEFNTYSYSILPASALINATVTDERIVTDGNNFTRIIIDGKNYLVTDKFFDLNFTEFEKDAIFGPYQDQPAIRSGLRGIITKINDNKVRNVEELREELDKYGVGGSINVQTDYEGEILNYSIELGESHEEEGRPVMGIIVGPRKTLWFFSIIEGFKEDGVAYKPKTCPEFMDFIYYLLAWIIIINFLVALVNMLPVGIFDGGRFWYLTILAITKNERIAKKSFVYVTGIILLVLLFLMVFWFVRRFMLG